MDTIGIIREVENDPGLKAALRAALLGDEMLELPSIVGKLAVRVEELTARVDQLAVRVEELAAAQQRTEARVEELAAAQQRTEATLHKFMDTANRRFDRLQGQVGNLQGQVGNLEGQVGNLQGQVGNLENQVGDLQGSEYERRAETNLQAILSRTGPGFRRVVKSDKESLIELFDAAVEDGRITEDNCRDALVANMIVEAERRDTHERVYVVAEASITVDAHDVERAAKRAHAISMATGVPAIPVVIGRTIPKELPLGSVLAVFYATRHAA